LIAIFLGFVDLFNIIVMSQKTLKLTFTITPNPNGYVVGCEEIPTLFTDVSSVSQVDSKVKDLLADYVFNFPDEVQKRGIDNDTPIQMVWRASPNSVALD
jgi:hypothetical protein